MFKMHKDHTVTSLSAPQTNINAKEGLRPVNLRTDLNPLADLIELVFADSMDEGGRAAIREMRYLSKMGLGLNMLSRLNDLALGISLGFVWIADGKLIGNVSIYPAGYPKDMGDTWIIANVGVHPDYQGRGIAHQLMLASLDMIKQRNGKRAILQVNYDNPTAQRVYERLGFAYEGVWGTWGRSNYVNSPPPLKTQDYHITRLAQSEWQAEFALAQKARPNEHGGLGWLIPLHKKYFQQPFWKRLVTFLSFGGTEKLIIRDDNTRGILASLWVESSLSTISSRVRLMTDPDIPAQPYADALLNNMLRRLTRTSITIEHPSSETDVIELLRSYQFRLRREVWHMSYKI